MNSLNDEISSCLECYYHLSEGVRFFLIASDKWVARDRILGLIKM